MYLPLGRDVLIPMAAGGDPFPDVTVGPYELRGETLGGALQLLLADVDIPLAFQTDLGLSRTVTVTNLRGKLTEVVQQVCSLADLYCAFERGTLTVKERQSFTVSIPPLGALADRETMLSSIGGAIKALTGREPVIDKSSRTIVYEATSRTADQVNRYFQKMRASTSLVIFETYVWEVSLNSGNASGIKWDAFANSAKWKFGVSLAGTVDPDVGTPISIGLPTTNNLSSSALSGADVLKFISSYGAVKTISQPQLTVLSGSAARLRVADKQNYVSKITRTVSGDQVTVSTDTASVESGFTLNIESAWDNATVYGTIGITLQDVRDIVTFDDNPESIVQLPQTAEREVQTQVRVRPGDSLLIAGLVREIDSTSREGPGIEKPIFPTSRSARVGNVELVFLLKPRVIVFTDTEMARERALARTEPAAGLATLKRGDPQAVSTEKVNEAEVAPAIANLFAPNDGTPSVSPPSITTTTSEPAIEILPTTDLPPTKPKLTLEPVTRDILPPTSISPLVAEPKVSSVSSAPPKTADETAADVADKLLNTKTTGEKKNAP